MSSEEIFDKVKEIIVEQLGVGEDSVTTFIRRGNASGTMILKDDGKTDYP